MQSPNSEVSHRLVAAKSSDAGNPENVTELPVSVRSSRRLKAAVNRALDIILPPRCPVSGDFVDRQGMLSHEIWKNIIFLAPPLCPCCGMPLLFDEAIAGSDGLAELAGAASAAQEMLCSACIADPPAFITARSAVAYNDESRALILRFKNGDHLAAVHSFVPWLLRAGAEMLKGADYIVPVPLHYRRLLKRRYNQAAIIAHAVAKQSRVPCATDIIRRSRHTPSQSNFGFKDRRKNVRDAFTVPPKRAVMIAGKKIVIIDDVYTTGATTSECAKALLKAGAEEVHILTIARVAKDVL